MCGMIHHIYSPNKQNETAGAVAKEQCKKIKTGLTVGLILCHHPLQ